MQERIVVHHIGGRGYWSEFQVPKEFESDIEFVVYEADPDSIEQMNEFGASQRPTSKYTVLPVCLGGKMGKSPFRITYNPYGSSLYPVDPNFNRYVLGTRFYDCVMQDELRTMKTIDVDLVTLDHVVKTPNAKVPPPDVLILDVQGAESDIISGATKALAEDTLAVMVECSIEPMYKDQKLFGDVCSELNKFGFRFIRFFDFGNYFSYRHPVGFRSEGTQVMNDGLFLKRIENITSNSDSKKAIEQLYKLAFIGVYYNQFDFTYECLAQVKNLSQKSGATGGTATYKTFLSKITEIIDKMPKYYPPTTTQAISFDEFRADSMPYLKRLANPVILNTEQKNQRVKDQKQLIRTMPALLRDLSGETSELESFLLKSGFEEVARSLQKCRIENVRLILKKALEARISEPVLISSEPALSNLVKDQPLEVLDLIQLANSTTTWLPSNTVVANNSNEFPLRACDADPQLLAGRFSINVSDFRFLSISLKIRTLAPTTQAQLFWLRSGKNGFDEENSVKFPVLGDGAPHTYIIDLWHNSTTDQALCAWPSSNRIEALRFDPMDAPGEFAINEMKLISINSSENDQFRSFLKIAPVGDEIANRYIYGTGMVVGKDCPLALSGNDEIATRMVDNISQISNTSPNTLDFLIIPDSVLQSLTTQSTNAIKSGGILVIWSNSSDFQSNPALKALTNSLILRQIYTAINSNKITKFAVFSRHYPEPASTLKELVSNFTTSKTP